MCTFATGHARIEAEGATGHAQLLRVIHRRGRDRTCATKALRWGRDRTCASCRRFHSATGHARINAPLRLSLSSSCSPLGMPSRRRWNGRAMLHSGKRLERYARSDKADTSLLEDRVQEVAFHSSLHPRLTPTSSDRFNVVHIVLRSLNFNNYIFTTSCGPLPVILTADERITRWKRLQTSPLGGSTSRSACEPRPGLG